jgi:hypothetical protein
LRKKRERENKDNVRVTGSYYKFACLRNGRNFLPSHRGVVILVNRMKAGLDPKYVLTEGCVPSSLMDRSGLCISRGKVLQVLQRGEREKGGKPKVERDMDRCLLPLQEDKGPSAVQFDSQMKPV